MACQIEEKCEGESAVQARLYTYRSVVNYERLSEIFEFKGEQLNKPESEGAQDTGKGSLFLSLSLVSSLTSSFLSQPKLVRL